MPKDWRTDYPKSYPSDSRQGIQPGIFDPASKHYARRFRWGDPVIEDPKVAQDWLETRRAVFAPFPAVCQSVSLARKPGFTGKPSALKAWLGDVAREPGDVDWVFPPSERDYR